MSVHNSGDCLYILASLSQYANPGPYSRHIPSGVSSQHVVQTALLVQRQGGRQHGQSEGAAMWFGLALLSALFQVLRNMSMKHLGHELDDTINVWGRFTFI